MNYDQELRERLVHLLIGAGWSYEGGADRVCEDADILEEYIREGLFDDGDISVYNRTSDVESARQD